MKRARFEEAVNVHFFFFEKQYSIKAALICTTVEVIIRKFPFDIFSCSFLLPYLLSLRY